MTAAESEVEVCGSPRAIGAGVAPAKAMATSNGNTQTLHDAFLDELRDAYDAEKQLIKALPKLAKAAESDDLRTAFETHLGETQRHAQRLERVFSSLGQKARGKHCDGIAGIIEEGKSVMDEDFEGTTLDACLIAAGQRAEHYEMAAYGTLVAWARAMGHDEAVGLLEEILEEEKAADEKLTAIAEGGINDDAAAQAHPVGTGAIMDEPRAPGKSRPRAVAAVRSRATVRTASKRRR